MFALDLDRSGYGIWSLCWKNLQLVDVLISEEKSRASSIFEELCDSLKFNVRVVEGRGVNPGGRDPQILRRGVVDGLWNIILYLFKSHHFLTYFQYMIRYNNISRPPLQPHDTPCAKSGVSRPHNLPRIDALIYVIYSCIYLSIPKNWMSNECMTLHICINMHGCRHASIYSFYEASQIQGHQNLLEINTNLMY